MFELAKRPDPAEAAAVVVELETRLAKDHWDRVKSRDDTLTYNKKDRSELATLTPGYDWAAWFARVGGPGHRRGRGPPADLFRRSGEGAG